ESGHFGGEDRTTSGHVEAADRSDAAPSLEESVPKRIRRRAERRHDADAGHGDRSPHGAYVTIGSMSPQRARASRLHAIRRSMAASLATALIAGTSATALGQKASPSNAVREGSFDDLYRRGQQ